MEFFNVVSKRYWKSVENDFFKCVGTLYRNNAVCFVGYELR